MGTRIGYVLTKFQEILNLLRLNAYETRWEWMMNPTSALPAQPTSPILFIHRLRARIPIDANRIAHSQYEKSSLCEALITEQA